MMKQTYLLAVDAKSSSIIKLSEKGEFLGKVLDLKDAENTKLYNKMGTRDQDDPAEKFYVLQRAENIVNTYNAKGELIGEVKINELGSTDDISVGSDGTIYAISENERKLVSKHDGHTYITPYDNKEMFLCMSLSGQVGLYRQKASKGIFSIYTPLVKANHEHEAQPPTFRFSLETLDDGASQLIDIKYLDTLTSYVIYSDRNVVKRYLHANKSLKPDEEYEFDSTPIDIIETDSNIFIASESGLYKKVEDAFNFVKVKDMEDFSLRSVVKIKQ